MYFSPSLLSCFPDTSVFFVPHSQSYMYVSVSEGSKLRLQSENVTINSVKTAFISQKKFIFLNWYQSGPPVKEDTQHTLVPLHRIPADQRKSQEKKRRHNQKPIINTKIQHKKIHFISVFIFPYLEIVSSLQMIVKNSTMINISICLSSLVVESEYH